MSPAAATAALRSDLDERVAAPIRVVANGQRATIAPAKAGLGVDVPATVAAAGGGRSWDPVRMWEYFAGGNDEQPVVTVDRPALAAAVAAVADRADIPATEGSVTFVGDQAEAKYPDKGTIVDRPAAARAVRAAFLHTVDAVDLPTAEADPVVSKDAVSRAMDRF